MSLARSLETREALSAGITAPVLAGPALIRLVGVVSLSLSPGGSLVRALRFGTIPFLFGERLKAAVAASVTLPWQRRETTRA